MSTNRENWYLKNRGESIFTGYEKEVLFSQGQEFFEGKLSQYPNAYDITVLRYYEKEEDDITKQTRAIIQSLAGYKNINNSRKILARKTFGLRTGDLIHFMNDVWLVTDWVNKQRTTDDNSGLTFCNANLLFNKVEKIDTGNKDDFGRTVYDTISIELKAPCCYKVDALNSYEDGFINLPDNKVRTIIQYTNLISIGDEVNVAGTNYRIYGIDKSYVVFNDDVVGEEYGILILTLEMPVSTT